MHGDCLSFGRSDFHYLSKILCFPSQSCKIMHLPTMRLNNTTFFFISVSQFIAFQILLGCALLSCRRNDALSLLGEIWGNFNSMLNSTMQNWKLCNLVCYTNWWCLMVDCVILFLSVLISTDLAGQMASSVDYISFTTYINYLFLSPSFFFFSLFCGEKLVFQRV